MCFLGHQIESMRAYSNIITDAVLVTCKNLLVFSASNNNVTATSNQFNEILSSPLTTNNLRTSELIFHDIDGMKDQQSY